MEIPGQISAEIDSNRFSGLERVEQRQEFSVPVDEISRLYKNPRAGRGRLAGPCSFAERGARSCDGGPHILRHASHDDAMGGTCPLDHLAGALASRPSIIMVRSHGNVAIAAFNLEVSTA